MDGLTYRHVLGGVKRQGWRQRQKEQCESEKEGGDGTRGGHSAKILLIRLIFDDCSYCGQDITRRLMVFLREAFDEETAN